MTAEGNRILSDPSFVLVGMTTAINDDSENDCGK
jgi:hypothetical protein